MRRLVVATVSLALTLLPALACDRIPLLARPLDDLLKRTTLPAAELARLAELRREIAGLASAGKLEKAREVEERAMRILGYRKAWLKCGEGTFAWIRLD
jgi:hypothetical protein